MARILEFAVLVVLVAPLRALLLERRVRRRLGRAPAERVQPQVAAVLAPLRRAPRSATFAAVLVTALVVVEPALAVVGALAAGVGLWTRRRRRLDRRSDNSLPELVDLLGVALGAGATVAQAVTLAVDHGSGAARDQLATAVARWRRGMRLADALVWCRRAHPDMSAPLDALVSAERYGTPIGPAFERIATEARAIRRHRAELEARRLPVRLLFPLTMCILPAVGVLAVVPLLVVSLGGLGLDV